MITENNITRLKKLVGKYAKMDFNRANPKGVKMYKNGETNYKPYSLSPLTNEAREMLQLAQKDNISPEEENIVKSYLLNKKISGEEDENAEVG